MKAVKVIAALCLLVCSGCETINDDRIPVSAVNIPFVNEAQWNLCGVSAAMDWQYFIRNKRIPSDYAYTASCTTGYGGVLLVCDVLGNPAAYDLACPVERSSSVRLFINTDDMVAECPQCGSTYDVFSLSGHPLSGTAADKGYGLKCYHVGYGSVDYMLISY